jgi:hypothetical protein
MKRDATAPAQTIAPSDEILRGVPAIASFLGVNRKSAAAFIKAGLPVVRLGLVLATTRRLAIAWVEKRAEENVCG